MKKENLSFDIKLLLTPVVLMVLGVALIFNPDFASALIAKVLGWALLAVGTVCVISALTKKTGLIGKILLALACFSVGGWLLANPLRLAAAIGRIIGIFVAVKGIQDIANAIEWKCGMTFALVATAVGVLLIVLPMTTSRLVFLLCGVVVLLVGLAMLIDRLKLRRHLLGDGQNIVDSE